MLLLSIRNGVISSRAPAVFSCVSPSIHKQNCRLCRLLHGVLTIMIRVPGHLKHAEFCCRGRRWEFDFGTSSPLLATEAMSLITPPSHATRPRARATAAAAAMAGQDSEDDEDDIMDQ